MKMKNYYDTLGVEENASNEIIKKSYKKLAFSKHPDRNKSPNAHEEFIEIQTAYEVLKNPNKRLEYDNYLKNKRKFYSEKKTSHKRPPEYEYKSQNAERYANMRFEEFEKILDAILVIGQKANNTIKKVNRTVDKILYWIGAICLFPTGILLLFKSISNGYIGFIILSVFMILIGYALYRKAKEI